MPQWTVFYVVFSSKKAKKLPSPFNRFNCVASILHINYWDSIGIVVKILKVAETLSTTYVYGKKPPFIFFNKLSKNKILDT